MSDLSPSEAILQADREFRTGNYNEAIRLCYEGLRSFPEFPSFYSLLSQSYTQLGQIEEAIEVIEQAIELFPFQRTFQLLLDDLHNKITQTPKEPTQFDTSSSTIGYFNKTIYSMANSASTTILSRYLLPSPTGIFVNTPRNYFATRIDIPDIPKPRTIGLLVPISRLINTT